MDCDSDLDPESLSTSDTEPLQKEVGIQTTCTCKCVCVVIMRCKSNQQKGLLSFKRQESKHYNILLQSFNKLLNVLG